MSGELVQGREGKEGKTRKRKIKRLTRRGRDQEGRSDFLAFFFDQLEVPAK